MQLLPEAIQTILKCISAAPNLSNELSQEILLINSEVRLMFDKLAQKTVPNPNNFDLLQTVMNNMSISNMNSQTSNNFNSPNKIFTPPIGIQQNPLQSVNLNGSLPTASTITGFNSTNILMNNNSSIDSNKVAALSNLLANQSFRISNYTTGLIRPISSPQSESIDQISQVYSKELEEEVEKCIMRLFKPIPLTQSLSVDDFADILAKCKDSHDKKEKDFYAYALKYLIDGNSFLCNFFTDDIQFHTLANLWGILIDRVILNNNMLANCLKLLLQMLSKSTNAKYIFAIKVLDRCKNR